MTNEKFLPVVGYEELYLIGDAGTVIGLPRKTNDGKLWPGKVIKPTISAGYLRVMLHRNGKGIDKKVHRLVAEAFIGKSDLSINHKDGNKLNNCLSNLEYLSNRDNVRHAMSSKNKSSKFVGIDFVKKYQKYRARFVHNKKSITVGFYDDEQKAHIAMLIRMKEFGITPKY